MEHYRCHTVYVDKTISEHIADTVEFPPEHNKIPGVSNQESATNAALDLIEYIPYQAPTAPFASIGDSKLQSISKLSDILKKETAPQEAHHKETAQTRVVVKHNNPTKTNAYQRVRLPINLLHYDLCKILVR